MVRIISILTTLGALILSSCARSDDHAQIYQELKSVDKLVFASMAITKTAKMESTRWYTVGKRLAVYSYDYYMRAYIDLSELEMDDLVFDDDARTVKVTLPPVVTEVIGRDMDMRKEYDNVGFFRDSLDSKERAEIKENANDSFRAEMKDNSAFRRQLAATAKRKAHKYFEALFAANGYTASIDFQSSNIAGDD